MSELRTNRIIPRDGLTSGTYSGGGIIQVKQAVKTDADFSSSSTSYVDITGLSVSITPTRSDSKVLVFMDVKIGCTSNVSGYVQMVRDSTAIYIGDVGSNSSTRATAGAADDPSSQWPYQMTGQFLDSPATTSATTYKIQLKTEPSGNTGTVYVNRATTGSGAQDVATASSILVMEVSG